MNRISIGIWGNSSDPVMAFFEVFFNVVLFVPFGLWLYQFEKWKNKPLIVLLFPLIIETIQLISCRGVFEVHDILWNTVGGLIGLNIFWILQRIVRNVGEKK